MSKPFAVNDTTQAIECLCHFNKALAVHTWSLVQKCREVCLDFRDYLKKAKEIPGNYLTKRCHVSMLKGRVAGLTDGLVIAGAISPAQAELLCDFAYALN